MPGNYGPDESEQDLPTSLPGSTNTNKQACKQISKQASKQTNKQANKHTFFYHFLTNRQKAKQASTHARTQASKQASKQAYMLYIDMPACMHVTACVGVLISKHKYTVVSVCLCVRGLRAVLPMIKKMSKCTDRYIR